MGGDYAHDAADLHLKTGDFPVIQVVNFCAFGFDLNDSSVLEGGVDLRPGAFFCDDLAVITFCKKKKKISPPENTKTFLLGRFIVRTRVRVKKMPTQNRHTTA